MIYCYRKPDGTVVELVMTVAQMLKRQRKDGCITLDDGTVAIRDMASEHGGFRNTTGNWPMCCDASGANPSDIPDRLRKAELAGVKAKFNSQGQAVFESRSHRKACLKAWGFHDRSGGYGDYCGP